MSQLKKIILLLLTFSICSHAEKGVNPEIWFAHSVIVTAYDGAKTGNIYDSKIPLDERAIIGDIEDRFRKWGRYHVVTHLEDADIVILVKKASGIGIGIGGRSQLPETRSGVDLPGTGDLFAVYPGRRADPLNGPVIWRDLEKDGLKSPEFKAFQKFRKQVEESEKSHKP